MSKMFQVYGIGQALIPVLPPPLPFENPPNSNQTNYEIGQLVYTPPGVATDFYLYAGAGNWIHLTDSDGTVLSVLGTANQITATNVAGVVTLTIPATFIAPGSIASTTTIAAGTALSAATTVTAGTGITATTGNIVASTGNITSTLGSVSAATTVTGGTGVTATTGNVTASNGNIVKGTAGNKDVYTSVATNATAGANSAGTVTLAGGTATVATTAVTANSLIRLSRQGIGTTGAAALGFITRGTITPSTSFVINAVQAADATALQASDVSVVFWEIVN